MLCSLISPETETKEAAAAAAAKSSNKPNTPPRWQVIKSDRYGPEQGWGRRGAAGRGSTVGDPCCFAAELSYKL